MRACLIGLLSTIVSLAPAHSAAAMGGTITGVATAPDGARLPGVRRTGRQRRHRYRGAESSGEAGGFDVGGLPPGRYSVEAELDGFEPRRSSTSRSARTRP